MTSTILCSVLLLSSAAPCLAFGLGPPSGTAGVATPPFQTAADPPDGKALFIQHCATCHGENGDGKGATELDRPARSFQAGGFSFGNTPEALYRTISTGIPGTPMPGFDTAIDEAGRRVLASYVRSLGPQAETENDAGTAVLEVEDTPRIVRGHLPPMHDEAEAQPRGLLIGTTSGLTFEYRADDVRLLGLRQGAFVKRSDWSGRGGTPLEPLGPVIHTLHDAAPGPLFKRVAGSETEVLSAKLESTWVQGEEPGLSYELTDARGTSIARVDERVRAARVGTSSGFYRSFDVQTLSAPGGSRVEPRGDGSWSLVGDLVAPIGPALADDLPNAKVYRDAEAGIWQVVALRGDARIDGGLAAFAPNTRWNIEVLTLLCGEWSDDTRSQIAQALLQPELAPPPRIQSLEAATETTSAESESDYYTVEHFVAPDGAVLEIGGLDFLSDGTLVVSTRRGQVWMVHGALADDVRNARFSLFAEGLNEGLGLKVVDDEIFVVQRGELSKLVDEDGDGHCDHIETISDDWGLSGNYHEFAFGLPRDNEGHFYVGLNVGFWSPKWWHGKSKVPYRGWTLRIGPNGETEPFASGFRSPSGLGRNSAGDIFVTDNQGDWVASSPIFHLKRGGFYGHPASLNWTEQYRASQTEPDDENPPALASQRVPPAVWIPYDWSRSTGNLVEDPGDGSFGPFAGGLFVAELTNGMVLRTLLEKVRGEYQGACIPFRQQIGSVCRVRFAPDGSLFAGLTNRGWGGLPPADGLARVRWTGRVPLEVDGVHLLQDGFQVHLTKPLAEDCTPQLNDVSLTEYDYNYWWEYGSPEQERVSLEPTSLELSADRRELTLRTAELTPAKVVRVRLRGLCATDGTNLLHEEFAYTINQLPSGPLTALQVAKIVEPPPPRNTGRSGWLRLTWGDALDGWHSDGWELCNVMVDPKDESALLSSTGNVAIANTAPPEGPTASNYISKSTFGSCRLLTSFMLPEDGDSGVLLMGRYEVQLIDSVEAKAKDAYTCGGITPGPNWPGNAPTQDLFKRPGTWHELKVDFKAPSFDQNGRKVANARFVKVWIDGTLVQEDVELLEPSTTAIGRDEIPLGPVVLQGDRSPVAFGSVSVKPMTDFSPEREPKSDEPELEEGFVSIFNGEDLSGWKVRGAADWEVDNEKIVGRGEYGFLVTDALDYAHFDLRARVKINEGGNSGLFARASIESNRLIGYEATVNSTYPSPDKTGSLAGLSLVRAQLIEANTWFDYEMQVRDQADGVRIKIYVNGILFTDYLDTNWLYSDGHIGIEQFHEGSIVEIKDIRVRRW